jgi:hypothetical protein
MAVSKGIHILHEFALVLHHRDLSVASLSPRVLDNSRLKSLILPRQAAVTGWATPRQSHHAKRSGRLADV